MKPETVTKHIINKIIDSIKDRSGVGDEWQSLDVDIENEIRIEWKTIIMEEIKYVQLDRRKTKRV